MKNSRKIKNKLIVALLSLVILSSLSNIVYNNPNGSLSNSKLNMSITIETSVFRDNFNVKDTGTWDWRLDGSYCSSGVSNGIAYFNITDDSTNSSYSNSEIYDNSGARPYLYKNFRIMSPKLSGKFCFLRLCQ